MVNTLCFHCNGHGFDPQLGTKIPHTVLHSEKIKIKFNPTYVSKAYLAGYASE